MDASMRQESQRPDLLGTEARRLMDFKSQHVKNNNQTPCPQCATLVSIQANKCPQCTSDIADHTQLVREELQRLTEVTEELYELHQKEMELLHQEAGQKPLWQRLKEHFSEPRFLQDMKIVLPFMIGLFAVVIFLKENASDLVFLLGSVIGAFVVYFLFNKWDLRKYVTLDLYRAVLLLGVIIVLSSTPFDSTTFWPETSVLNASKARRVAVQGSTVNIRQAPTTKSNVVTRAHKGDKLKVLEERDSWYQVETESGSTGWVYANLVK